MTHREIVQTRSGVESYIVAQVPDLEATVWIYPDQINVETPTAELRLEEWEARTPEEQREKVVAFLRSL